MNLGQRDKPPTFDGLTEIVTQKSIEKLHDSGLNRTQYLRTARRMVRAETIMLPGLREIYAAMSLKLPEPHFIQLTSMGGVRRHFGFTLVTRRIMLPTEATA